MTVHEQLGYAAYWDGYDHDCMKHMLTRQQSNEFVKGWIMAQEEDTAL